MTDKTYTILLAQDVPFYGCAQLEADSPDDAIRAAKTLDPGDFCNDPDWQNTICRRIVHIEAPDGHLIATDISLDDWIVALVPNYPPKKPPRFNHAFSIAFSLDSHDADGNDAKPTAIRRAIYERLASIDDDELIEAVGAPFDSYELQPQTKGEAA